MCRVHVDRRMCRASRCPHLTHWCSRVHVGIWFWGQPRVELVDGQKVNVLYMDTEGMRHDDDVATVE